jgi:SagB-type dehydrogenase family enzyme
VNGALATTLAYHERTKHFPGRFARSLGHLDWATQPDPFRRFASAPLLPLDLVPARDDGPGYEPAFYPGNIPPRSLDRGWVSQLLQDGLALSAWKQAGGEPWSLRVNPSSGNLHPTEGYLVAGPIAELAGRPAVYHYAPREHALERRVDLSDVAWGALASQLPAGSVLAGLTSIYWRESWKYGERGFRYCQHDVGHAIAALTIAAAGLGWEARLLEGVTDADLARLLGLERQQGAEAEHPECLLALVPQNAALPAERQRAFCLPDVAREELGRADWLGTPNRLSSDHHPWPVIDQVAEATRKIEAPPLEFWESPRSPFSGAPVTDDSPPRLRRIIQQRRSAVALDGRSGITSDTFFQILSKVLALPGRIPFSTLPWQPCVDLLLFVHRVQGVEPGLYLLLRDPARREILRGLMTAGFAWTRPEACPAELPLYLLESGDARRVAQQTSCGQEIAGDGVFAAAMLADFSGPIQDWGPWFYRRLFWETGVVGQQLYLEAEASGIRGTGIGCFFDDMTHRTFELAGGRFQVLYHFTMGGPVEDARIQTISAYQHLPIP